METLPGQRHLFQSPLWATFQRAQGRPVFQAQVAGDNGDSLAAGGWSWLAALRRGRGGVKYLYAAYGPTVSGGPEVLAAAVGSLVGEAQRQKADFVRLEPLGEGATEATLKRLGARKVADMQPRHRLVQDISPDEAALRRNISSSNRNLINTAEKRGLSFRISSQPTDLPQFLAMQAETAARGGFTAQSDAYYQKLAAALLPTGAAKLYFADFDGQPIAGAICVNCDHVRYYLYAAAHPEANRQHKAAIALLWWLILDAKANGLTSFDYGGVAPADAHPTHPWAGHTRFKKSIAGDSGVTLTSVGTWEIPLKPTKYRVYQLARRILER